MIRQIKKFVKAEFKRSNAKAFLFFLTFSVILWLLVQFSKTYNEVIEVPITFRDFPKDKLIEGKGDKIRMEVEQNGFQLAWLNFFTPSVKIDLSELPSDSTHLHYNMVEHRAELSRKLSMDLTRVEFLQKEIQIPYELKDIKKVPIVSDVKINYAPGFSSEEEAHLEPDSVTISGPRSSLDTISRVFTEAVSKKRVDRDVNSKVKLKQINPKVTLYENEVGYSLEVQKFTERTIKVPLNLVEAPPNLDLNLFPSVVEVTFMVSLDKFELVKPVDFNIICDYSEISIDQNFFIPKIESYPKYIKNVKISPKKVHYIIKK